MSIVRIGLAETKHFAQGYDAIFGKKKASQGSKTRSNVTKTSAKKARKKSKKK